MMICMIFVGEFIHRIETGLVTNFFIDARDIRPPTRPPAVPSRASMKKIRPPMAKYGQYRAKHGPPQKRAKICHIYIHGLYTPDIPYIYGLLLVGR